MYFVLNLAGAGRGDVVAHNGPEMAFVIFAIFVVNFFVTYVQAHVFTLVYKFTMNARIFAPVWSDMEGVLKKCVYLVTMVENSQENRLKY